MLHWPGFLLRLPPFPRAAITGGADQTEGRTVIGDMIDYEILLLLDPDVPEERENEIVSRIREEIERSGGSWERHDAWGRRKLAYEIDHKGDGSYHLLLFQSASETLAEISRVLKITDGVLRHLAVRRPKAAPEEAVREAG